MKDLRSTDTTHREQYPIYLQRSPQAGMARNRNQQRTLGSDLATAQPNVPADLVIRVTGRAPHDLSRTSLCVIDLLLRGDLMFDRITEITSQGGTFKKGFIKAELDIKTDLWFFKCHFKEDPVMPGCLGLDAMWQLVKL